MLPWILELRVRMAGHQVPAERCKVVLVVGEGGQLRSSPQTMSTFMMWPW